MPYDADPAATHNPTLNEIVPVTWLDLINANLAAIGAAWTSYVPTFSGTLGNGTVSGAYLKLGRTVLFRASVAWGSTTTHAAAQQTLTLPATATSQTATGSVYVNQGGTARRYHISYVSTTTVSGEGETGGAITDVLPVVAWANGHYWNVSGLYEATS